MATGNPKQKVGMMYPIWAPLTGHTEGSMPTYGTGIRLMEARTATVTYERNGQADYGDDRIVAEDNGASGMTMSFESTGIIRRGSRCWARKPAARRWAASGSRTRRRPMADSATSKRC